MQWQAWIVQMLCIGLLSINQSITRTYYGTTYYAQHLYYPGLCHIDFELLAPISHIKKAGSWSRKLHWLYEVKFRVGLPTLRSTVVRILTTHLGLYTALWVHTARNIVMCSLFVPSLKFVTELRLWQRHSGYVPGHKQNNRVTFHTTPNIFLLFL